MAPGVGEFGEAMDQEDKGLALAWRWSSGFEDVENQGRGRTIEVAGRYAWWKGEGREGLRVGIRDLICHCLKFRQ